MSPAESSLLRAVLADPDADEPRLAYADHLAESSRTNDQARAEFIRVQIELANCPTTTPGGRRLSAGSTNCWVATGLRGRSRCGRGSDHRSPRPVAGFART